MGNSRMGLFDCPRCGGAIATQTEPERAELTPWLDAGVSTLAGLIGAGVAENSQETRRSSSNTASGASQLTHTDSGYNHSALKLATVASPPIMRITTAEHRHRYVRH